MIGVIVRIARIDAVTLAENGSCIEIGASVGNCVGMRFTMIYCVHDYVQSVQTSGLANERTLCAQHTVKAPRMFVFICANDVDDDGFVQLCAALATFTQNQKYNKRCRARRIHNILYV